MKAPATRIAINIGGGYVPGLNAVLTGTVLAASQLGWEVVGIRDGFDGILLPEFYPEGGLVTFSVKMVENISSAAGNILGTASTADPFRVRTVNAENQVEEVDRSDSLLDKLKTEKIDAVVSVAGARALSILWKLSRKGLNVICVPESVENDVAGTMLSFGFNSALSCATETLDRARQAAQSARRLGVVEVLGEHAGWLALQSGMAVCADAVLIPEIPYDLKKVAAKLRDKCNSGQAYGLVVVAEGARPSHEQQLKENSRAGDSLRASLAPLAKGPEGAHVIDRSGHSAETVALELQRLTDQQTYPLVLGQLVKGWPPTTVDRQLGIGYGAAAVHAIHEKQRGVLVSFQPPDLKFVPLCEAINKIRTIPPDSLFIQTARSIGICLGD